MKLFCADEVFMAVKLLENARTGLEAGRTLLNKMGTTPNDPELKTIIEVSQKSCLETLSFAEQTCKKANLTNALVRLSEALLRVKFASVDISGLMVEMEHAVAEVLRDISIHKFLAVDPLRAYLLGGQDTMGASVAIAFPSAVGDIKEAGNCLAAECNTAAVFHLMRVVEYGLRALAQDRRITLPKKGHVIELATWEDIIKELEKAEIAIQGYPKTLAREAQYEFHHGAMMQFRRFKNIFRNRIMHAREEFGRTQALGVFENVRDFMGILASRISETRRTPVIWKGPSWTK